MSGPLEEPPAASRGLADILREAGVSSAGSGGRRRRRDRDLEGEPHVAANADDEASDTAGVAAGTDGAAAAEPDEPAYNFENVRAADLFGTSQRSDFFDAAQAPSTGGHTGADTETDDSALSSYLLADSRSETGTRSRIEHTDTATQPPPRTDTATQPPPRTDTGPVPARGWSASQPSTTASQPIAPVSEPAEAGAAHANRPAASSSAAGSHANRSASPVTTTDADDKDEDDSAVPLRGGVAGWAVLAVELLAALGLGVAAWYAFSALWELLPYVAAFAGPLVVTGLVAVAGALRSRTGRNPLGLPTLCILVFAGTVLVVLPAATVIVP